MHDGVIVTPFWTITSISEKSNWTAINDPCTLELGSGWRIPTTTEWTNVDASGGWGTWIGPWNSGLRLHAAGRLFNDGSLQNRGSQGYYNSSTQSSSTGCWSLFFGNGISIVAGDGYYGKAYGFTLRCIRE